MILMKPKKFTLNELKKSKTYPFYVDDKAVYHIENINDTQYYLIKICSKFIIEKVVMNNETKEIFYDTALYDDFGKRTVRISKAIFTKRRFHELLAFGLDYYSYKLDFVLDYIEICVSNAAKNTETNRLGWDLSNETELFYGYDASYAGDKNIYPKLSVDSNEQYFDKLNELIKDSIGCQLAVSLSLSSVFVAYLEKDLHIGTPIFHFYGDSSSGKSTALILASSMWGNPTLGNKLYNSWNATDNGLLNTFNNNYGVTLCFDEAGLLPRKSYSSIIYSISEGVDKSRYTSAINPPPNKTWQTVCLSSGEQSLLDSSNQNTGLRVRSIEFLDLPITNSAEHSKEIKSFCSANYGVIGKWFVEDFANYEKSILSDYHKVKEDFDKLITSQRGTDERIATIFSVVLLTAQRLTKILNLDIENLKKFLANYINDLGYNTMPLSDRAYNAVVEWISCNTPRINCYYGKVKHNDAVAEKLDNSIIIKADEFKRLLADKGFTDVNVVAKSLKKAGLLIAEGNGLRYRYTFEKQRVDCYRIILSEEESKPSNAAKPILDIYNYIDEGGLE